MLVICSLDDDMNLEVLLELIDTMICHLESSFVVMLILNFILLRSFITIFSLA